MFKRRQEDESQVHGTSPLDQTNRSGLSIGYSQSAEWVSAINQITSGYQDTGAMADELPNGGYSKDKNGKLIIDHND
jgi:hypothetical protein